MIEARFCVTLSRMRNRDTSAATAANTRRKHDRWAKEMIEKGHFVDRTGPYEWWAKVCRPGRVVYATNGLKETYRVAGWTGAGEPILAGRDGDFIGLDDYLFTTGPK